MSKTEFMKGVGGPDPRLAPAVEDLLLEMKLEQQIVLASTACSL